MFINEDEGKDRERLLANHYSFLKYERGKIGS